MRWNGSAATATGSPAKASSSTKPKRGPSTASSPFTPGCRRPRPPASGTAGRPRPSGGAGWPAPRPPSRTSTRCRISRHASPGRSAPEGSDMLGEGPGPAEGIVEGPAVLRQVEVLDRESPPVVEGVEPGQDRGEVHGPARVVDMELGRPGSPLAKLHVVGVLQQLDRVTTPVGDVTGVDEQPQPRNLGSH